MKGLLVKDLMTYLVVTVRPDDAFYDVAKRLVANRISGAPVVEGGRLVGLITESDLVAAYMPPVHGGSIFVATTPFMFLVRGTSPRAVNHLRVRDVMTVDVVSISPDARVWEAASLMDRHGVRRLPVVDEEGFVAGVIARADLVRALARTGEDIPQAV